jgi:hypothetical protein
MDDDSLVREEETFLLGTWPRHMAIQVSSLDKIKIIFS